MQHEIFERVFIFAAENNSKLVSTPVKVLATKYFIKFYNILTGTYYLTLLMLI